MEQSNITQIFQRAKKNKHQYTISTQAFSTGNRQFVIHNLSLRRDYTDQYDIINFRRGLAYVQQIINFNHTQPIVARKGLRKFQDLLPQYLNLKESHVNASKHHASEKNRLFGNLQTGAYQEYCIYNTEKLNGENAQISYVFEKFWIIGTKNKCLMLCEEQELEKIKNRHEHKLTILIAKAWFALLKNKKQEEINGIKLELSGKTLIGEYCNSQNLQHLVDYGKQPQIFFYALVQKDNKIDDCLPTSESFKFLQKYQLPQAKYSTIKSQKPEQTKQHLRQIVHKMNEQSLKQGGQGGVLYITGFDPKGEHNLTICKVKTIQYRIYRKLREKLKIYLTKFNKNYDNLLKKFSKQIAEIARDFQLNKPLQHYIQFARKSFILCQDQNRPISKYISNRFINFLRLVEKNITKEKFMEIVNSNANQIEDEGQQSQFQKRESMQNEEKQQQIKQQSKTKKVLILIPVTIPSTGKTSLLTLVQKSQPKFRLWSISSDEIKRKIMDDLRKKMKNMSREQAFQKSRQPTNKQYYKRMGETFKNISLSQEEYHVFYLDKNHPENVMKTTVKEIKERSAAFSNIQVRNVGLFPDCQIRFEEKGSYRFPYSVAYILTCLKRVSQREEHATLQGTVGDRCKIVLGFANFFRNFSLSPYNIKKYFDEKLLLKFNNQSCLDAQRDAQLLALFKQIILSGKPGNFEFNHRNYNRFIQALQKWQLHQISRQECVIDAVKKLSQAFSFFDKKQIPIQEQLPQKSEPKQ